MKIQIDNDWWKDIFDEVYLQTDARSVCDESLTCQEVDFLEQALDLDSDQDVPILDMCGGQGRHALELAKRGFTNVTVLDYSEYLVGVGKKAAEAYDLDIHFIRGDARNTGLAGESFQFVIVMGSSFGYFVNEAENRGVLNEAYRMLRPDGAFLLDLPDRDYVLENFKTASRHKASEDIEVCRTRSLKDEVIYSRETVFSEKNGRIRDKTYCTRLYSPEAISDLIYSSGFSAASFSKDFMCRKSEGEDYGFMTNRMVVKAEKD